MLFFFFAFNTLKDDFYYVSKSILSFVITVNMEASKTSSFGKELTSNHIHRLTFQTGNGKILGGNSGSIVFRDNIRDLSHDNYIEGDFMTKMLCVVGTSKV